LTTPQSASSAPYLKRHVATFEYTGKQQDFNVPTDVTRVTVVADGASAPPSSGVDGRGGQVKATIAVTPGETLAIFVGGGSQGPHGGYNGGAGGGYGTSSCYGCGEGGGGASDLRQGGNGLGDRVVVAGGGGGAGADDSADGVSHKIKRRKWIVAVHRDKLRTFGVPRAGTHMHEARSKQPRRHRGAPR
jgi:hypothetical protein